MSDNSDLKNERNICVPKVMVLQAPFTLGTLATLCLVEFQLCFTNPEIEGAGIASILVVITLLQAILWIVFIRSWSRRIGYAIDNYPGVAYRVENTKQLNISSLISLMPIAFVGLEIVEITIISIFKNYSSLRVIEFQFLKIVLIIYLSSIVRDYSKTLKSLDEWVKPPNVSGDLRESVLIRASKKVYAWFAIVSVIITIEIGVMIAMMSLGNASVVQSLIRAGLIAEVGRQTFASIIVFVCVMSAYCLVSLLRNSRFCFRSIAIEGTRIVLTRGLFGANLHLDADISEVESCWINENLNLCFRMKNGTEFGGYVPSIYKSDIHKKMKLESQLGYLFGNQGRITYLLYEYLIEHITRK